MLWPAYGRPLADLAVALFGTDPMLTPYTCAWRAPGVRLACAWRAPGVRLACVWRASGVRL
eukprot:6794621-Prymnesium_polylepis.1